MDGSQYSKEATRWLSYIVGVVDREWGDFLHIKPVDVLLKETKQGEVQGGQSGLLALKTKQKIIFNMIITHKSENVRVR